MREQGAGVIVNISSLSAVDPFDGLGFYGACKAWMDLMTQALAKEGSNPVGLLDSLGHQRTDKVAAGEPVGGGGVSDKIKCHVTSSCRHRLRGPGR